LGENAKILSVTRIAKWKTSVQIIAISCLFLSLITQFNDGVFEGHSNLMHFDFSDFLSFLSFGSIILLWIASVLTFLSGFDYLSKTLRFIKNENKYD
jgi:CDP-diacylglycerol--glycerol-3-phosphate 3-phosphatidyltransferase